MGCAADPRRTAQARHRRWADECSQVHGAAEATAVPGLDDLSAQPCRRDRRDGSFRGADDFVPASVWLAHLAPRSTPDFMAGGHRAPDRRVEPCRRAWRAAPSTRAAVVHEILQRGAHTLITEQGCADTARCPGRRAHSVPANLGRIASPIRPDLIFDRDTCRAWLCGDPAGAGCRGWGGTTTSKNQNPGLSVGVWPWTAVGTLGGRGVGKRFNPAAKR